MNRGLGDRDFSARGACFLIDDTNGPPGSAEEWFDAPTFADWMPITACATNFVTRVILGLDNVFKQMQVANRIQLHMTNLLFQFAEDYDIDHGDIKLLYKGGNIMRFVLYSLQMDNPELSQRIDTAYGDVFKPSDMDFSVYIGSPGVRLSAEKVHELGVDIEKAMVSLADMFSDPAANDVFEFHRYSDAYLEERLEETLLEMREVARNNPKLPEITAVSCLGLRYPEINRAGMSRKPSAARRQLSIDFDPRDETMKRRIVCERGRGTPVYVSNNRALLFQPGDNERAPFVHFDLIRMKLAFIVEYYHKRSTDERIHYKSIGGEIIDVSINHSDVAAAPDPDGFYYLDGIFQQKTVVYTMNDENGGTAKCEVDSYSISYLVYDVCRTLFIEPVAPWETQKYEKRLKRVMGLLLCQAFDEMRRGMSARRMIAVMEACVSHEAAPDVDERTIWATVRGYIMTHIDSEIPEAIVMMQRLKEYAETNVRLIRMHDEGTA